MRWEVAEMSRPAKVPTPSVEFRRAAMLSVVAFLSTLCCETVARRVVASVLLLAGVEVKVVVELAGLGKSAAYDLRAEVFSLDDPAGCGALMPIAAGRGRKGSMEAVRDEVLAEMGRRNFFDRGEIREFVRERFGFAPGLSAISSFLRDCGQRKLRCGSLPGRANPEWQAAFWEEVLEPLLERAREEGSRASVLFVDASHFVMGCDFLGRIWCGRRRFVRTLSGRRRHDVLGALDYVTKAVTRVCDDEKMDSARVIALLEKVAEAYEGREVTLVMDNARYQRNRAVLKRAEELGIAILFIPPYSPNLNLIERLWRMVKGELRKRSWRDFDEFKRTIDGLVDSTTGENRERVETLIGERVQLFVGYREVDECTLEAPPYVPKAQREAGSAA